MLGGGEKQGEKVWENERRREHNVQDEPHAGDRGSATLDDDEIMT